MDYLNTKEGQKMANIDAVRKYQKTRDAIMIRPAKEHGDRIRQAAADEGMSVQAFIFKAIDEYIRNHSDE